VTCFISGGARASTSFGIKGTDEAMSGGTESSSGVPH